MHIHRVPHNLLRSKILTYIRCGACGSNLGRNTGNDNGRYMVFYYFIQIPGWNVYLNHILHISSFLWITLSVNPRKCEIRRGTCFISPFWRNNFELNHRFLENWCTPAQINNPCCSERYRLPDPAVQKEENDLFNAVGTFKENAQALCEPARVLCKQFVQLLHRVRWGVLISTVSCS